MLRQTVIKARRAAGGQRGVRPPDNHLRPTLVNTNFVETDIVQVSFPNSYHMLALGFWLGFVKFCICLCGIVRLCDEGANMLVALEHHKLERVVSL